MGRMLSGGHNSPSDVVSCIVDENSRYEPCPSFLLKQTQQNNLALYPVEATSFLVGERRAGGKPLLADHSGGSWAPGHRQPMLCAPVFSYIYFVFDIHKGR